MIHRTPFFLPVLYPSLTWRIPTQNKYLYLTFDDGPVPGPTEFVLEILVQFNIKATFFCIGENIYKNPTVFREIIHAGHTIGNHTFNHLNGWKTPDKLYMANIEKCSQTIMALNTTLTKKSIESVTADLNPQTSNFKPQTNNNKPLFRPPYGRISRQQIKMLRPLYNIIMWDVLSCDFNQTLSPESCLQNSIQASRPGSIIIFHDSYKAEKNLIFALPRLIDHFLEKGFQFKSL